MTVETAGSGANRSQSDRAVSDADPLDQHRRYRKPVPDSSVGRVHKVARLDARTHIVAARRPGGQWYRLRARTRFTRANAASLRADGVSEVILRRHLTRASFPLGWLSQRSD